MVTSDTARFPAHMPTELRSGFDQELARSNLAIVSILLPLIAIFEAYNIAAVFLLASGLTTLFNVVYFLLYVVLLCVTLVMWGLKFWIQRQVERRAQLIIHLSFAYSFFIALWSTTITVLDQRGGDSIVVYVITVVTVAIFVYMRPWQVLVLFGVNHAVLLCFFTTFQEGPTNNRGVYINTTVLCVLAICMSLYRYYTKTEDYLNKATITRQNEKIRQINEQLRHMTLTDTLTGLNNRRFFDDVLAEQWRNSRSVALLMLDIDNFKRYNDVNGHQAGDRCLQALADVMREQTTPADYLMRYGGEEFTILLVEEAPQRAMAVADSIRQGMATLALENHGTLGDGRVTVSIGVYVGEPSDAVSLQVGLGLADKALYEAKRMGKNRVVLYQATMSPDHAT